MKSNRSFTHALALAMAAIMIIGTAAGCGTAAGPAAPSTAVTEPVSSSAPSETAAPPIGTEEPTAGPEQTMEPAASAGVTQPVTGPAVQPVETAGPSGGTGNTEPAPTEHTHSFRTKVTAPTCTEKGYTTYTCTICGYSYKGNETAASGHSYQSAVIAPTCTKEGYTLHTCTVCGSSYTDSETAANGHTWSEWVTVSEPTYSSEGTEERTCSVCGATESRQTAKLEMSKDQLEQEVLRLVNIEREKAGAAPLEYYSAGQQAADIRAQEIQQLFSHTRPDGRTCFTVFEDLALDAFMAGENIAAGFFTPEAVMTAWMNSEGHRSNILSSYFTGIVIGYDNGCWVQIFIH